MGRWSRLTCFCCFMSAVGCAIPTLNKSNDMPSMPDKIIPNVSTQPIVENSATSKDPDLSPEKSAKLCLATAEELEKNGHLEQAIGQYELSLKHQPRQPGIGKKLAACYAKAGHYDKSIAQYQKCLSASPKDADLLNDLGYTYYEMEDYVNAEKYLKQAITIKASHQRAHGNLGLALGRQQKWKESLDEFKKAGPPAVAQANLAAMYFAAGEQEEARRSCNIALGLEPNLKSAKELLAKLDELPKDEKKTVQQAEARLLKEPVSRPEVVTAQAVKPNTNVSGSEDAGAIQLQRPVRVNRQTVPQEFRPVK